MTKDEAVLVKELFSIIDQLLFIGFRGVNTDYDSYAADIEKEVVVLKDQLTGIKR